VLNARLPVIVEGPLDVLAITARTRADGSDLLPVAASGAACVFVPARLDAETAARLVDGIGLSKVSVIAVPGGASAAEFAAVGVARLSFGPWAQRVALTALADVGVELLAGGPLPAAVRPLV
jgi:2-methylisocitrate lyase-like PEP mutase family enzyme